MTVREATVGASVVAFFFWMAFIGAVFTCLAWIGQKVDERDRRRGR